VYVYTNLRVLNLNITFRDEATMKWNKQSVVSKDSNSNGPTNLFDAYVGLSNVDTLDVDMDSVFTNDKNTQAQLEEVSAVQGVQIGEDRWDRQDWAA
jgi:hypothetical protein